jgi:hypothetical protein
VRTWRSELGLVAFYLSLAAAVSSWYVYRELMVAGHLGFPLDDSWIHQQIARNVASGQWFSFNPGEPTSAATAPLWTLLLALPSGLGFDAVLATKVLGTLIFGLNAFVVDRLAGKISGSALAARAAGVTTCVFPALAWGAVSGMEVPLAALLVTATLLMYESRTSRSCIQWGFLAGLAAGVRPEALIVWPVLFVFWIRDQAQRPGVSGRRLVGPAMGVTLALLPLAAWNLYSHSRPWPVTLDAKALGWGAGEWLDIVAASTGWKAVVGNVVAFMRWLPELGLGFIVALIAALAALPGKTLSRVEKRLVLMVGLIVLCTLIARALVAPWPPFVVFQEHRYASYLLVPLVLIAALGVVAVERQSGRRRWPAALLGVWLIGSVAAQLPSGATRHAEAVANINQLQVAMGQWVNRSTSNATRVATHDVGAVGYVGRRYVLDTEGMVTPLALQYRRRRDISSFLVRTRPDLVVILPEWFPELRPQLETWPVCHVEEAEPVVVGGRRFVAFRTPWARPGMLDCPNASNQFPFSREPR